MRPIIQESLNAATLRRLAEGRGVCLSFFLPDRRPGTATANHQVMLRQLLREASVTVSADLLEPLEAWVEGETLAGGGPGLAIFSSKDGVECFRAPGLPKAEFVVASHFHLTPLLELALVPKERFVLGVSRKKMLLFHWKDGGLTEVAWPNGVPVGLDEAEKGRIEQTGNHATSTGLSSVQFGSGNRPDREWAGYHLTHFYRMVDAGITPVLAGVPLILGGVEDDLFGYRKAAHYPHLATPELVGGMEHLKLSEIAERVRVAIREEFFEAGAKAAAAAREGKALSDPTEVLQAAVAGRVHRLCVREGAVFMSPMPPELARSEDFVNAGVAETLRAGGDVFVVRPHEMEASPVVAVLRY